MKVTFWGCRGSLPASYSGSQTKHKVKRVLELAIDHGLQNHTQIDNFIRLLPFDLQSGYGTNTPCVQVDGGEEIVICDAGSGIRDLGQMLVGMGKNIPRKIHILMSHLHWDHIQGFPFFVPAYIQGVHINIYGCHDNVEETFVRQQRTPTFPVALRDMGSHIEFHTLDPSKSYSIGGMEVSIIEQPHPGTSYGFRFVQDNKKTIYSTDAEHSDDAQSPDYPFLKFIEAADLLIFDAQFNLADHLFTKQNWGHSSNLIAVELAVRAGVKKLCLFHSEHSFNDEELHKFELDTKRYLKIYNEHAILDIVLAHDGLSIDI